MDHCLICGAPITTKDCLVAIEKHTPRGEKGCSVEFRWVPVKSTIGDPDAYAFGSKDCVLEYFDRWIENHMRPEVPASTRPA